MSASDLAANLRRLPGASKDQPVDIGDDWHITGDASIAYWLRRHAFTIATALERGERSDRCHVDAVKRFAALCTALMQSIAEGEPQFAQLELIGDSCDACDCVDDESIALYERAKAVAAASARDRERGAAAEAVVAAWRSYEVLSNAGTAKGFAVLAAYDALTDEARTT